MLDIKQKMRTIQKISDEREVLLHHKVNAIRDLALCICPITVGELFIVNGEPLKVLDISYAHCGHLDKNIPYQWTIKLEGDIVFSEYDFVAKHFYNEFGYWFAQNRQKLWKSGELMR